MSRNPLYRQLRGLPESPPEAQGFVYTLSDDAEQAFRQLSHNIKLLYGPQAHYLTVRYQNRQRHRSSVSIQVLNVQGEVMAISDAPEQLTLIEQAAGLLSDGSWPLQ